MSAPNVKCMTKLLSLLAAIAFLSAIGFAGWPAFAETTAPSCHQSSSLDGAPAAFGNLKRDSHAICAGGDSSTTEHDSHLAHSNSCGTGGLSCSATGCHVATALDPVMRVRRQYSRPFRPWLELDALVSKALFVIERPPRT